MAFIDEMRHPSQYSEASAIPAIEERIAAAEEKVDKILGKRAAVANAPGNAIDRNHDEIMAVLARMENSRRNDVLQRMARLETKLQHVA
jgi:hypothetical protein